MTNKIVNCKKAHLSERVRGKGAVSVRPTLAVNLMASLFLFVCVSMPARAEHIFVTKFTDTNDGKCDSDCSLREAVVHANQRPGPDHIHIEGGVFIVNKPIEADYLEDTTPYAVDVDEDNNVNGDIDITDSLIIEGRADGSTIIRAEQNDRIFDLISGKITLKFLTLENGRSVDTGGALLNHADATLWHCNIKGNRASSSTRKGFGGGIANYGKMSINASHIVNNVSSSGEGDWGSGGGIFNAGSLYIRESTIEGNYSGGDDEGGSGGGLFNQGYASVSRSTFLKNNIQMEGYGSAIFNMKGGKMKLARVTVSDNWGGDYRNEGGAVANGGERLGYAPGKMSLLNVTIVNNANGGLVSHGNTTAINSIIAGNIRYDDSIPVNCTLKSNLASNQFFGVMIGRQKTVCFDDYEIENKDVFITVLHPLAYNGGRTLTHALRKGSAAIDAALDDCPELDQNRVSGPNDGNGDGNAECDLGAVEFVEEL